MQCVQTLLTDERCERAVADLVARVTGRSVPPGMEWRAESVEGHEVGRPDLVAAVPGEPSRLVMEAKFDHAITTEQIHGYRTYLSRHPDPQASALILLVPEHRRAEGEKALAVEGDGAVVTGVVSWDQLATAMRDSVSDDPALMDDLRQFEGLCETYGGKDIRPFTEDEANGWPARADDLKVIVDRVTAGLSSGPRLYPLGTEKDGTTDGLGYYRRYLSGVGPPEVSLGVRQPRKGHTSTLWLRYHSSTRDFSAAKERLLNSEEVTVVAQRGHVYVPLMLPTGVSGVEVVRQLEQQVQRVHTVALGEPWPA